MFLAVMAFDAWLKTVPNRFDRPARAAVLRFIPKSFDPAGFAPFRLAGAWKVEVDDPRFGGVSALAVDRGGLQALTDSGSLIWLPRPGTSDFARVRDLHDGPGDPGFKRNRDSEALLIEPDGGWFIAFENQHSVWRYVPGAKARRALDLSGQGWRANEGVEAMVRDAADGALILLPESGHALLRIGDVTEEVPLRGPPGQIADAARLPDGRILLLVRRIGITGVGNSVSELTLQKGGYRVRPLIRLPLGVLDNAEAAAAETLPSGVTRLWLMTDNDFRPRAPTLLVALDLP